MSSTPSNKYLVGFLALMLLCTAPIVAIGYIGLVVGVTTADLYLKALVALAILVLLLANIGWRRGSVKLLIIALLVEMLPLLIAWLWIFTHIGQ